MGRVDGIECWEEADARTFMIRGVNYMKDRRKVPSDHSIYRWDCVSKGGCKVYLQSSSSKSTKLMVCCVVCRLLGCDIYSFGFKINHISRHIQLPTPPILGAAAYSLPPSEQIPPLLVINIQLPMYPVRQPFMAANYAC